MLDATRYERLVIDRYRFRGFHRCDACCALEILRILDSRSVVVATELKDNPGTSVTNSASIWLTACVWNLASIHGS